MHLIDLPAFYPPHQGGVEAYAYELHSRLLETDPNLRITVLTSDLGASAGTERISDRWTVVRWPAREPVAQYPVPSRGFRGLLRTYSDPNTVIMTHTRFYVHALLAGQFARSRKLGWIHVEHGSTAVQSGGPIVRAAANLVDRTAGRSILTRADVVMAVSASAAEFVSALARREASVQYRGIEIADGPVADPRHTPPVVCYVGRLLDGKGVGDLLLAVRKLAQDGEDVRLRVCGDGPARVSLEKRAVSLGLSDRVDFLGAVSHRAALAEIAEATVFVNPSWTEGLPTTVLEAAALGAAVVATDVGGTSEIITDASVGWLTPARDPEALAGALADALSDVDRRAKVAGTLRAQTLDKFHWNRTVDGFRSAFSSAAARCRRRRQA